MSADPCPMALLVEALRDGRLSEREAASVHRHLATCAPCTALAADLARVGAALRVPPLSPLEHRRGRMRLLREAAGPRLPPRRAPARVALAVGLLAGIAGVMGAAALLAHGAPPAPPAMLSHLPPIARPAPARTETRVLPEEGSRFTQRTAGGVETVVLEEGAVRLSVRPLSAGERFLVETGDAEVEVRGTVFRVEAQANHVHSVQVTEGKVEIRFRGGTWFVTANASWRPPVADDGALALSPLVHDGGLTRGLVDDGGLTRGRPALPPPNPPADDGRRTRGQPARTGEAVAASSARDDDASSAFRDGVRLADRGDYDAAAQRLRAFSEAHPHDDRAEDAAFLVVASMQRAGRHAEARAAARRYLARYPNGYRRAEVQAVSSDPDAEKP